MTFEPLTRNVARTDLLFSGRGKKTTTLFTHSPEGVNGSSATRTGLGGLTIALLATCIALLPGCSGCTSSSGRVVVYSAQDEEFAERLFASVKTDIGLTVVPKYDTEANKSVSLAAELEQEAAHPRCDLHWNNEPIGTIRLARKGVYQKRGGNSIDDRLWVAFAERARVLMVNTNLVPEAERPKSLFDLTDPKWKGRVAMAKPQFGTTATHAACLFEVLGSENAKAFFRDLKANDVNIVAGNKPVARGVADGTFAFGITDTDDAILELLAQKPVAIVFPDGKGHSKYDRLGTLFLPNTLAIVRGCPNPDGAKNLIDYLLSKEDILASGGGYQIPVNPELRKHIHPALKTRDQVKPMNVSFERAADLWDETLKFLRDEFAR
jgi:iron(III) transport system substrate-binding protein